ncbi:hypothetical protein CWC18_11675 [Pseudoalteromonas aurantia]|uniref:DUF5610 domain-containing protein n=1 Tax=Pseudoalteromonas aurantia TaxID=43654 RepID=A0A5S3V5S2_9GAMM|nr:DUF5610 domain-containing protein [Pseudoalteromonas aurantia]TMO61417.1 hypothetical protein CWC18_11675 [Pseudoalteromonas aurantia]TMO66340.1 hypothetical protein CWC19_16680 [Pseudoalteromonas aurantia]
MKIGQLNQLLNPANSYKAGNNKPFMPTIQNNADSYSGDKSKLAAKFLDDKLAEALGIEKKPEKEKPLFDFESIVKNVLDFVKGAVNKAKANGKDDNELRNMLGEARKGVKLGIDEATDALKESSVFNNEIEEGIEKSREGIFSGLDEFEKSLFEPQPDKMSVTSAQYASLSNQADYSFTTAEGDEVVISFSDAYSQNKGASYNKEGNNEGVAYAEENKQEVSFSISVNGDLNEDEQKAINEMMKDIRNVSDSFFSGEYDDAFEKAKELNIDNDQIANFTMDLRQTKTTAAISQYQQSNPLKDLEKALQPLDKQLESINESGKAFRIESQLPDILEWMNQGQSRLNEFLDYAQGFFNQLNQQEDSAQ